MKYEENEMMKKNVKENNERKWYNMAKWSNIND